MTVSNEPSINQKAVERMSGVHAKGQIMKSAVSLLRLSTISVLAVISALGCSNPQPGPDKTIAGTVLGAGWGAGAGAVIGNQVDSTGKGVAVGAGFGAVAGALSGAGYDLSEGAQLRQDRELASLKIQNLANQRELQAVQNKLDQAVTGEAPTGVYQVFFDENATSLRAGAISNLEVIADSIKGSARAYVINVVGHSDDAGNAEYNEKLSESRARAVSAYLGSRGIAMDQIKVSSFGSTRPIATNSTQVGRQLNRRVDIYLGQ
jgi:outer membrane protein OmpA-like peptidoglycan-associated protein